MEDEEGELEDGTLDKGAPILRNISLLMHVQGGKSRFRADHTHAGFPLEFGEQQPATLAFFFF